MTIEFDEKDHVVNVWFADDIDGNNLMMILRRREDGQHVMNVRLREKIDDRVFDSEDRKNFWQMTFKRGVTEEAALVMCNSFWLVASQKYCMHQINQRVDGGPEKFAITMEKYVAFHSKELPVDSNKQERL